MEVFRQSPTDPAFVQNPYPFYERLRAAGEIVFWEDYDLPVAVSHRAVSAVMKDKRLGREPITSPDVPPHLQTFYGVEAHSMLELEPPRHTRLRALVLRAFTSRRIAALDPEITALCHSLIDQFSRDPFDLLQVYAQRVPVIVIARLLGVPETQADQLLIWSNAMVAMYQARRGPKEEAAAEAAAKEFSHYIRALAEDRRNTPADDLITHLLQAEADGTRLTMDELVTTCILLLNAGHEATVHTLGNAAKLLLESGTDRIALAPGQIDRTVEEVLRCDPPLHMFTRTVYETVEIAGETFLRGDEIACLLGAANRDPTVWPDQSRFDPTRPIQTNLAFGAGIHFCVGAPLARLELKRALAALFERCPNLRLVEPARYANLYHFHGLERLMVEV